MLGIQYWAFILPICTGSLWLADVIGLLALWSRDGFPQYVSDDASFVFISDVGAVHTTWFIVFSVLTAIFYIMTVFAERHLRSTRRIPGSVKKRQTVYDVLSVVFACLGALFLGLLSGLNDQDYSTAHWLCALLFILCVGISVLFQILELFSLSHWHNPAVRHLKWNGIFKAVLLSFAFCVLITFVGLYATCHGDAPGYATNTRCDHIVSGAATMEWMCAFLLAFFFYSYTVDLWPRNYYGKQAAMAEKRASKHGGIDPETGMVPGSTAGGTNYAHQGTASSGAGFAHGEQQCSADPYVNAPQDQYGTMTSTAAPSLSQPPLRETEHRA